jgi:hypothetical protein
MNKNNLETKLSNIYNDLINIPKIEFKKINENEYFYGSVKVKINNDTKNTNNITGNFFILFYFIFIILY